MVRLKSFRGRLRIYARVRARLASVSPGRPIMNNPLTRIPSSRMRPMRSRMVSRSAGRLRCLRRISQSPLSMPRLIIQHPARLRARRSSRSRSSAREAQLKLKRRPDRARDSQKARTRWRWSVRLSS